MFDILVYGGNVVGSYESCDLCVGIIEVSDREDGGFLF